MSKDQVDINCIISRLTPYIGSKEKKDLEKPCWGSSKASRRYFHNLDNISKMMEAQDGKCIHCGETMTLTQQRLGPMDASWEHLVPQAHGGQTYLSNLALAHRQCNHERGTLPLTSEATQRVTIAHKRLPENIWFNKQYYQIGSQIEQSCGVLGRQGTVS